MKRYEMPAIYALKESATGSLVMYSEALEAMQSMVEFAAKHVEEIEQGVGDFGDLAPLLAFMSKKAAH